MDNVQTKVRNSNFEILRIISMVLIVTHHYAVHGFTVSELPYSLNMYIVEVLSLGGKWGVSCFVLISGYFMVNSKITVRKIIKIIAETWFYSVGILLVFKCLITPEESIGIRTVICEMLPIGSVRYWFVTDYVILMLMSPILNLVIEKMGRTMHRNIMIGAVVLWSVVPTIFLEATYAYTAMAWFVVLYMFAAYIRKYVDMEKKNAKKHFRGGNNFISNSSHTCCYQDLYVAHYREAPVLFLEYAFYGVEQSVDTYVIS
jgi:surface polysaccharide O-acyltransferase-like enzyme